jgi:hypothetical protein
MSTNKSVGTLESVEALSFLKALFLVGSGTNPTTGWKNWFEPERSPDHYAFVQEQPTGLVLNVLMPFVAIGVFSGTTARAVFVRQKVNGHEQEVEVPVRSASIIEARMLQRFITGKGNIEPDGSLRTEVEIAGAAQANDIPIYRRHLGSIDIPFGCASWQHPLRARRFDLYLEVRVGEAQDVEHAVLECLQQSGVAAALITLFTPIGWATGTGIFQSLLASCLATKLRKLISVNLPIESNCV